MQDETPPIERRGDDYLLRLEGDEGRYRVTVPREMLDDEVGDSASDEQRRAWIRANLANILGSATARVTGGFAKQPWGRIIVEELD